MFKTIANLITGFNNSVIAVQKETLKQGAALLDGPLAQAAVEAAASVTADLAPAIKEAVRSHEQLNVLVVELTPVAGIEKIQGAVKKIKEAFKDAPADKPQPQPQTQTQTEAN